MPYLFNRAMRLAPGNLLDSMSWAVRITEKVNTISDSPVRLWSRVQSPGGGTLSWSTVVDSMSELVTIDEKLMADGGYVELAEAGSRFIDGSGVDDSLGRLVHADPEGADTAAYATVSTSRLTPGMMATGVALGVEMAKQIKSITGRPTSFGTNVTGPMGGVAFFLLSDTIDQVQAASEALAADAGWAAVMDERASKAFVMGVAERVILRRLA